jgi:hypothetical protein
MTRLFLPGAGKPVNQSSWYWRRAFSGSSFDLPTPGRNAARTLMAGIVQGKAQRSILSGIHK